MKNDQFCIASETIEQLRNFRDSISKLPFNNARKLYYSNLLSQYELRMRNENLQLDMLKLQLIAKLHQDVLTKSSFNQYSTQIAIEAANKLNGIFEFLSQRMVQNKQNTHKKIIFSIMNFKFHLQRQQRPKISLEELLVTVEEMNLWQSFTQQPLNYLKYFYLCLMWQYLDHQDILTFVEIASLYANYLIKKIQNLHQKEKKITNEIQQVLIDLLHCYNSFKLFKKQFNLQCTLKDQSQIYSLLYQLEFSLSQKIIYQYKKLHSKTKEEIIHAIKRKLQQNIIGFDQQSIDSYLNLLNEQHNTKQSKEHLTLATFHVKRISSYENLSEKTKNRYIQNLNPINNVFVPRRINPNMQLERRLQLKKQRDLSKQKVGSSSKNIFRRSNKKIANKQIQNNTRTGERQLTILNNLQQRTALNASKKLRERPTYESCKKHSTNKYEQLRLMICERNRGMSLKIHPHGEDINNHLMSAQKNIANRKRRMPNRKNSIAMTADNVNQKRSTWFQNDNNGGQIYPPFIRIALNQYIKGFTTYFKYQNIKYTLPLYLYFHNLDKSSLFYLKGDIIRFLQIETSGLVLRIVYTKNQKQLSNVQLKLYENSTQMVRNMFVTKRTENKLSGFYKLGGNLTYFSFNLKTDFSALPVKLQISRISYQQQIYSYNVYLTNTINKSHYKKILQQQQRFIKILDQELKIQFQYDKAGNYQNIQKKYIRNEVTLKDLLNANYYKGNHQWFQNHSFKLALKMRKNYNIVTVKHLENLQTSKKYLFFNFTNTNKLGTHFCILSCSKGLKLKSFIEKVNSWEQIKTYIITKKHFLQQNWTDLILNRSLFEFSSKNHVIAKQPKGYEVLKSQTLLEKVLDLVKGQSVKSKWFLLLNLSDLQAFVPSLQSCKSTRKFLKPARNKSIYNPTTFVSIKSRNNVQLNRQNSQRNSPSPVRFLKKEGNFITIGKQCFRCINYEYSWYLFLRQKIYYCFKLHNKILSLRIKNKYFIYFRIHSFAQKLEDRQLIFKQFRRQLLKQITQKWIVFGLMGIVGVARIENNSIVILIEEIQGKYSVHISATELYGISSIKLNHFIFNNKQMMQRVKRIIKYKLQQKMIYRL